MLAAADPEFAREYGDVVDLIVRDFAGTLAIGPASGLPPFRAFNAYLGSSAASGLVPFADGNNQESSSEAVAAWEAVVRWGLVRGNTAMTTYGVAHYALESATARVAAAFSSTFGNPVSSPGIGTRIWTAGAVTRDIVPRAFG